METLGSKPIIIDTISRVMFELESTLYLLAATTVTKMTIYNLSFLSIFIRQVIIR